MTNRIVGCGDKERLVAYLYGEDTLAERAAVEAHIALCRECAAEVAGFRDMRMGPYLQRIRADVLAASGDFDRAQQIEDQAAALSVRYDDPSSPTTQRRDLRRLAAK